jgi:AraC-like DNA-binding protein
MSVRNLNLSKTNKTDTTTFGRAFYKPAGACGWRTQPDFQLVIIHQGSAELFIDDSPPQHLQPGDAVLLRPFTQELFLFDRRQATDHTWVAITPTAVPLALQTAIQVSTQIRKTSALMNQLIENALVETHTPLTDTLGLTTLHAFLAPESKPKVMAIQLALNYMEEHIAEPLSIEQIAKAAFVSPQHLTRLYKKHFAVTPSRYLWDRRTQKGIELLRSTGLTVSEISLQLGFQSPFHFSRLVKQKSGQCPREYRHSRWNTSDINADGYND